MRARIAMLALAGVTTACFDGETTVGAICRDAGDCGPKQGCRHELCGHCGNGSHAVREVCYADRTPVPSAGPVAQLQVGDLDDDGRDDVVTLAPDGGASVLLAGASFATVTLPVPFAATAAALGDVDGDDDVDIAFAGGVQVAIAHNDGAGVFAVDAQLLTLGDDVRELGVAAPGEGLPGRLLATGTTGSLWWLSLEPGGVATELAVGTDVHLGPVFYWDEDQLADAAIVDHRSYLLTIVRATTAGYASATAVEVGRGPVAVIGFDRDGNSRLDFLTRDREGHAVSIVDGGKNDTLVVFDTLAFDREPTAVAAVDADLDGRQDILVGTSERLELWRAFEGHYPEGVALSQGDVAQLGVGRFDATTLFDLLVVQGDRLERCAMWP